MKKKKKFRPAVTKPVTVKLAEPIPWAGGQDIAELTLKVPKAKHMRAMPSDPDTDALLNLAGKLAGQPSAVIDELSIPDMMQVLEAVNAFFPDGQPTGDSVSE